MERSRNIGYWATHEYQRGSIIRDSDSFMGYPYLERNVFSPLGIDHRGGMYQAIVAALFQTGGRINEVLDLRRENFDLNVHKELVSVRRMTLLKRYEKVEEYWEIVDEPPMKLATGEPTKITKLYKEYEGTYRRKRWTTKKVGARRDFSYPKNEPLHTKYLLPWIEEVDEGKLFNVGYNAVYNHLYRLEVEPHVIYATPRIYNPHWFRGQRAAHLRLEYRFDYMDLIRFFLWESTEMPKHYASLGGIPIGEKMLSQRRGK